MKRPAFCAIIYKISAAIEGLAGPPHEASMPVQPPSIEKPGETLMAYEGAGRIRHGKWSRRSFIQTAAAGVATGVMGHTLPRRAHAADGLRSIGLGV
jgi:hypothetical protein